MYCCEPAPPSHELRPLLSVYSESVNITGSAKYYKRNSLFSAVEVDKSYLICSISDHIACNIVPLHTSDVAIDIRVVELLRIKDSRI